MEMKIKTASISIYTAACNAEQAWCHLKGIRLCIFQAKMHNNVVHRMGRARYSQISLHSVEKMKRDGERESHHLGKMNAGRHPHWASRGQRCSSGCTEVTTQAIQPHPRPKNAPAEEHKDSQPIWLGPLSLCYDLLSSGITFSHFHTYDTFLYFILFPIPLTPPPPPLPHPSSINSTLYSFCFIIFVPPFSPPPPPPPLLNLVRTITSDLGLKAVSVFAHSLKILE